MRTKIYNNQNKNSVGKFNRRMERIEKRINKLKGKTIEIKNLNHREEID